MRADAEIGVVVFVGGIKEFTLACGRERWWGWETGADHAEVEVGFDQSEAGGVGPEARIFVLVAAGEVVGFQPMRRCVTFRAGGKLDEGEGEGAAGADADSGRSFGVARCVGADEKGVEDVGRFERLAAWDQSSMEAATGVAEQSVWMVRVETIKEGRLVAVII